MVITPYASATDSLALGADCGLSLALRAAPRRREQEVPGLRTNQAGWRMLTRESAMKCSRHTSRSLTSTGSWLNVGLLLTLQLVSICSVAASREKPILPGA